MGAYRVELASTSRAGCNGTTCKKNKVKIQKGEPRLGVWVEAEKYQSWSWRHWGCVTPKVISNIAKSSEEDGLPPFGILDGLDELPEELQDKIKKAVEDGEIPLEDRTGVPNSEEADKEAAAATEELAKPTKSSKAKKRARADGEEADETAPKKSRKSTGKASAAAEEEASVEKPAKDTKASKTKKRARADSEAEEVAPKKSRKSTGKAATEKDVSEEKPAKRGRARKATEEEPAEKVAEPKKAGGRKRKTSATEEEGADSAEPEAKPAARKPRKGEATNGDKAKRGRPKRA